MGNTLYLECYSGISGDMTVGALLDLGADENYLRQVLGTLPVKGFDVHIKRVLKSGIDACDFDVVLEHENHDHDMEYLYGHNGHHGNHEHQGHSHHESEDHSHEHSHHHGLEGHSHEHRGIKEIMNIIDTTDMSEGAREIARKIFHILAAAEAKAHKKPIDEVHFHEVGAVDSIVDIISVAVCMDNLKITDVIVPCLYEGRGTVRCQHGILPVPVPAVVNIMEMYGLKVQIKDMEGEYITPTGAAIVAATKTTDVLPEQFTIKKVGIGAGKRVYDGPGVVRGMLIETV
ncbi:MAG: LarC family nickel insertion protein [Lachnospiraceae bacterium]